MSSDSVPPWSPGSGWRRDTESAPHSDMRVSDAERHEIADALSTHYSEGRLDQTEFDERMGRAMAAKTRGDLAGLLRDLPPLRSAAPAGSDLAASHPTRGSRRVPALAVVALFLLWTSSWAWGPWGGGAWGWRPHPPVFVIALLVAMVVRRSRLGWRGRRHLGRGIWP